MAQRRVNIVFPSVSICCFVFVLFFPSLTWAEQCHLLFAEGKTNGGNLHLAALLQCHHSGSYQDARFVPHSGIDIITTWGSHDSLFASCILFCLLSNLQSCWRHVLQILEIHMKLDWTLIFLFSIIWICTFHCVLNYLWDLNILMNNKCIYL